MPAETCSLSQEVRVRVRGRALTGSQAEAKLPCHSTVSPRGTRKSKEDPFLRPKPAVIRDTRSILFCPFPSFLENDSPVTVFLFCLHPLGAPRTT